MAGSVTVLNADGTSQGDPLPIETVEAAPAGEPVPDPDPPIVFIPPKVFASLVLPGIDAATRMPGSIWRSRYAQVPRYISPNLFDNAAEVQGALADAGVPLGSASGCGVVTIVRDPVSTDDLAHLRSGLPDGLHLVIVMEDHPAAASRDRPSAVLPDLTPA